MRVIKVVLFSLIFNLCGVSINPTPAFSTSLLANTFTNMSNSWDQSTWTVGGDNSSDPNYSGVLAHMVANSVGSSTGRLQLTDTFTFTARGYALNNQSLPTSGGIDIYFNTALYGSGGSAQADGLVFYLKSGTNEDSGTASLGVSGGSMGYSSTDAGGSGLSGALLGIGFDAYGNFYQKPFTSASGCTSNEDRYNVPINEDTSTAGYKSKKHLVIRGAMVSDRTHGYCRISTTNDELADYTGSNGGGSNTRNIGVSLKTGVAANIFSQSGAAIRIKIDPQDTSSGRTNGTANIYFAAANTTDWSSISSLTTFELPSALSTSDTFKFGFVAGTGGGSVNTQIWGLNIQSLREISACSPTTTTTDTTTLVAFKSTTICSYSFPAGVRTATALIVGGGGGGGGDTAGGGGGGAVETQTITSMTEPWIVSVGSGGAGGPNVAGGSTGSTGGSSSISNGTITYLVSGGFGGHKCSYTAPYCRDGAGGAGGVNSKSISSGSGGNGGYLTASQIGPTSGASGRSNSITGTAVLYGAGGGGGQGGDCKVGSTSGGTFGGGTGFICTPATSATAGQDWYGAGGGGGGTAGARGGNGVIYIQYVTPVPYTITSSSDVNGTISASGTTAVYSGDSQSYTFSPSATYKISNVLVDGTSQGAITSYTFTNVVANHTISVIFEKIATSTPTYVPEKSAEQIAAEAAAQKIADEKAAEVLAAQQKALSDNAEADKAFKTLQDQLATLLSTGVFPKLPTTTKAPTTTKSPTTGTTKSPTTTTTDSGKSGVTVPDGTVLITPNQIATLDIAKSGSGASANIAISQLKSGQRVRVTVISKADLNTKVVDLNSTEITTITPGPINPSPAVNPTLIDIKPAPKTNSAAPNKAEISVSGIKKNQRVRVTVKSK
jgi:hypothetical protein